MNALSAGLSGFLVLLLLNSSSTNGAPNKALETLQTLNISYTTEEFVNRAALGDIRAVDLFLEAGMDPNVKDEKYNMTPLIHAAITDQAASVRTLLERGADVNARDKDGHTALILAAGSEFNLSIPTKKEDRVYVIEKRWSTDHPYLTEGHAGTSKDFEMLPFSASLDPRPDIVNLLLEKGADMDLRDNCGRTALIYAAWKANYDIVKNLLRMGADPNVKDKCSDTGRKVIFRSNGHILHLGNGWTVLMYALLSSRIEVAQALLEAGANPNASDDFGVTPLMIAALQDREDVIRCLLNAGANPNAIDKNGDTALTYAVDSGCENVAKILGSSPN